MGLKSRWLNRVASESVQNPQPRKDSTNGSDKSEGAYYATWVPPMRFSGFGKRRAGRKRLRGRVRASAETPLVAHVPPMSSFEKSQKTKKTKRTMATKKMTRTKRTTKVTRSEHAAQRPCAAFANAAFRF
jgi:hypothetical protein